MNWHGESAWTSSPWTDAESCKKIILFGKLIYPLPEGLNEFLVNLVPKALTLCWLPGTLILGDRVCHPPGNIVGVWKGWRGENNYSMCCSQGPLYMTNDPTFNVQDQGMAEKLRGKHSKQDTLRAKLHGSRNWPSRNKSPQAFHDGLYWNNCSYSPNIYCDN